MTRIAQQLCLRHDGCQNVLAGYDIDNTLLDPQSELGSDEWFTWQASLLPSAAGELPGKNAVASDIGGLIGIFSQLISAFPTHPVDPRAPQVVASLQNMGIQSVVVTARSSEMRDPTVRELRRNGYDFTRRPPGGAAGVAGTFAPFDPAHPDLSGLSTADLAKFKLDAHPPLPVSYQNGVFMVSGQHKGAMLRTLLTKTGVQPKAILYIDDTPVQVQRMQAAFEGSPIELITIQYSKTYPRVVEFFESDKSEVVQSFAQFKGMRSK